MGLVVKKEDFTSDNAKLFTLLMDSSLFNTISVIAKNNRRSVAKEIEYAVARYVEDYLNQEDHLVEDTPVK